MDSTETYASCSSFPQWQLASGFFCTVWLEPAGISWDDMDLHPSAQESKISFSLMADTVHEWRTNYFLSSVHFISVVVCQTGTGRRGTHNYLTNVLCIAALTAILLMCCVCLCQYCQCSKRKESLQWISQSHTVSVNLSLLPDGWQKLTHGDVLQVSQAKEILILLSLGFQRRI